MPTEEEIQKVLSKRHKFFPLQKMVALLSLAKKPRTILEILNEDEEIAKKHTAESMTSLFWRLRYQKLISRSEKRVWSITKKGKDHLNYLLNRLETEFFGFEGLKAYAMMQREEEGMKRKEADGEKGRI